MTASAAMPTDPETIVVAAADGVATITLNRPERMNAFNQRMCDELAATWAWIRTDDTVRAVVVNAAGDRAFCTGVDVTDPHHRHPNPFVETDPGVFLGPKTNKVWKPVVTAVHGLACGGAFYLLNESDVLICSEDAQFFDPHVTYGLTAAFEPIGLLRRVPLGEVLRIALFGLDERVTANRALAVGLVTEVLPRADLWSRAEVLARRLADKPAAAVQGTVRAIWEALDLPRTVALDRALAYTQLGNPLGKAEVDRETVVRVDPELR
jgi:enoyl-CoA hydratase/carnithine racemase